MLDKTIYHLEKQRFTLRDLINKSRQVRVSTPHTTHHTHHIHHTHTHHDRQCLSLEYRRSGKMTMSAHFFYLCNSTSRQQQTPWNVEEKRPMRPGNHVCECVGTSCFMYVFWTVVVCRRMDLRKRAKNSKVKSRYKKFKEYASVVDKQQTCMS